MTDINKLAGNTQIGKVVKNHFRMMPVTAFSRDSSSDVVTTNFWKLTDDISDSFNQARLVIIGGRPGAGKTIAALSLAEKIASEPVGGKVAFFSFEMSKEQLLERLRKGEGLSSVRTAASSITFIDSVEIGVVEIWAKALRMQKENGLDLVVVDYLQLIGGEDEDLRRITSILQSFRTMAESLGLPVILVSQLLRSNFDKEPQLFDLSEAQTIQEYADLIILIHSKR